MMSKMTNSKVTQIFKIQRTLFTTEEVAQILVYNESRSIMGQFPATPPLLKWFPKDVFKVYARGTIDIKGHIDIQEVIEDRDW